MTDEVFNPISYLFGKQSGGGGSNVAIEDLSVTENGTYTPDTGKAFGEVDVNVPNTYVAGDNGKVVVNGALVAQTARSVTENGTFDTTTNNSVTVAVPERDPYLYENCLQLQLKRTTGTWANDPTITIDCAALTAMSNMCNGGGNAPGYKKIKLKNVPATAILITTAFGAHNNSSPFEVLELDGNLIGKGNCGGVFQNCKSLKSVTGGAFDLTASTNNANFAVYADKLETISFVPSSIKISIPFTGASELTDASLVSICNGLDGTVTGQTLTLASTVKAHLSDIVGTVTGGVFAIDAGGGTTLLDFATTTKGWTVA